MVLKAVEEVSAEVPVDDFQALEDKVYRTIELYKAAREAKASAERDVQRLRQQLEEREEEVETLRRLRPHLQEAGNLALRLAAVHHAGLLPQVRVGPLDRQLRLMFVQRLEAGGELAVLLRRRSILAATGQGARQQSKTKTIEPQRRRDAEAALGNERSFCQ